MSIILGNWYGKWQSLIIATSINIGVIVAVIISFLVVSILVKATPGESVPVSYTLRLFAIKTSCHETDTMERLIL